MTDRWFTDRRMLIAILGLIGAFLLQSATVLWTASRWFERMDNRVTLVERTLNARTPLTEQVIAMVPRVAALEQQFQRIDAKLDRLIEAALEDERSRSRPEP